MPNSSPRPSEFQLAPERNPEKYGINANNNQKKCSQLAADFFKDSVKRARERNQRYVAKSEVIADVCCLYRIGISDAYLMGWWC